MKKGQRASWFHASHQEATTFCLGKKFICSWDMWKYSIPELLLFKTVNWFYTMVGVRVRLSFDLFDLEISRAEFELEKII